MSDAAIEASEDWAGERAERWVRIADRIGGQLAPVADVLFAAARLGPGERVLDVGCGTGPTTRRAAAAVGPAGAVTGLDVSPEMLAAAGREPVPAGAAPIEWVEADAEVWRGAAGAFDVVLSRFGVMFFHDPPAAFANLWRLAAPGARLHAAVWAPRTRSELFELPLSIVLDACRRWGIEADVPPPDAAAFSLGDRRVIEVVLGGAGWREITARPCPLDLRLGGGQGPAEAAEASLEFGPARHAGATLDRARRREVIDAIAEVYRHHLDERGHVVLGATPVLVSARRPA